MQPPRGARPPRVLLVSSRERGHLNPLLPLVPALQARGAAVGWLVLPAAPPRLRALGAELFDLDAAFPEALVTGGPELAALVRDPARLRTWIADLLVRGVPAQIPRIEAVIQQFQPDVVATDPMIYAAVIAAHRARLPWVSVSSSLNPVIPADWTSPLIETVRGLEDERRTLFAREGLQVPFAVCDALSPWGTTVWSTSALVGERGLPPHVHLVGPSRGPVEPAELPEEPLLYASFGSQICWQPEAFRVIAAAAERLGLRAVFAAGGLAADEAFRVSLPGRPIVVAYAPQLVLLSRARVFLSHGGAGSVMEALDAGVPLLLHPVCNDQPHTARLAAERGLARVVGSLEDPSALAAEVRGLLADREMADRRLAAQRSYRAADGAAAVAELLLRVSDVFDS